MDMDMLLPNVVYFENKRLAASISNLPLADVTSPIMLANLKSLVASHPAALPAMVLLNGEFPTKELPNFDDYSLVVCSDGAYQKALDHFQLLTELETKYKTLTLAQKKFIKTFRVDVVIGDGDSGKDILQAHHQGKTKTITIASITTATNPYATTKDYTVVQDPDHDKGQPLVLHCADQNSTDFEKCMDFIADQGCRLVHIFGASGKEQDHYLGNLSTAYHYHKLIVMNFIDDYGCYFFAYPRTVMTLPKHTTVSLFPYPKATQVKTLGLHYKVDKQDMEITGLIGTRNYNDANIVALEFEEGALLVFASHEQK